MSNQNNSFNQVGWVKRERNPTKKLHLIIYILYVGLRNETQPTSYYKQKPIPYFEKLKKIPTNTT
ncbi:MAG: hypothetical protein QNJ68_07695 [Microcoleaceae cyanobacterium MO_207.B10]|nr:hypothetical protein [Microcoleaceae cyanobacterium MO_207.B10]